MCFKKPTELIIEKIFGETIKAMSSTKNALLRVNKVIKRTFWEIAETIGLIRNVLWKANRVIKGVF